VSDFVTEIIPKKLSAYARRLPELLADRAVVRTRRSHLFSMPAAQLVRFGALAVEGSDDLIGGNS
jgi:hypothetical protein